LNWSKVKRHKSVGGILISERGLQAASILNAFNGEAG
jgi:hypothetical protein